MPLLCLRTCTCAPLLLLLLLLAAPAAHAALVNSSWGAFKVPSTYVNAGATWSFESHNNLIPSDSGNGVYLKGLIPSSASVFTQGQDFLPYWRTMPFGLAANQSSLQTCLYVVNATGLAALNSTDFTTSTTTCPTLTVGAVATVNGSKWTAQCQGVQYSPGEPWYSVPQSWYSCLGTSLLPTWATIYDIGRYGRSLQIIYPTSQFGPPVAVPGESNTFYEVYFVYAVIGGNQGLPVNVSMSGALTALTALSPPPPQPPQPPQPPSPSNGSALQLTPVAWTLALALIMGQMVMQLTRNTAGCGTL